MAEKVGDVYVTVHADNSRLHNELRAQAARDGKSYANEFDRSLGQEFDRIAAKNRQRLAKAFASGDFSEFEKEMGSVEGAVRKVNDEVDHLISKNDITLKQARQVKEAVSKWAVPRTVVADTEKVRHSIENAHAEALKMNQAFGRAGYLLQSTRKDIQREAIKMNKEFDRIGKAALAGGRAGRGAFATLARTLRDTGPIIDRVSKGIGSMFGEGSRNNFLNIVGKVMKGMVDFLFLPLKMAGPAASAVAGVADGIDEVGKSAANAERNVANMGTAFATMVAENANPVGLAVMGAVVAAVAATIGVALVTVASAMGVAAAAVSVLAGMLLSLASAAAFALAGGLLPLIPAALALAPALFIVISGMEELRQTSKKAFAQSHKDLMRAKEDMSALKVEAGKQFVKILETVSPTLVRMFAPAIKAAGDAMVFIAKDFAAIMNTPGMKTFIAAFQKTMPNILKSLGLGFNRLLTGLTAFFAPILPFAQRLADAFLLITQRFTDWAQSAGGQKAITDFMTKAWQAASTLWSIIVNLSTAIGQLFAGGQQNGQGFLDWLNGLLATWSQWLGSAEGQATLKQWFDDAKTAAQHLWDLISSLWTLFDSLDTSTTREQLNLVIDSITGIVQSFGSIILAAVNLGQMLSPLFRGIALTIVGAFAIILTQLANMFGWIPGGVGENLTKAALHADQFVSTVNKDFDAIDASFTVVANTATAMANVGGLVAQMEKIRDKDVKVTVNTYYATHGPSPLPGAPGSGSGKGAAAGDIAYGPQYRLIGEAGAEAIVPLHRPLAMVDPAVRALSAIAQGKPMAAGGVVGGGKTVNVAQGAIVVNTSQANPRGVALSVLDRLTAAAV